MRICTYDDKTVIETGCHIVHVNCKNRENKESYFFSQQWLQYLQGKRNLHLLVNRLACKMSIVYIEMKMCEYKEADSSSFFFFFSLPTGKSTETLLVTQTSLRPIKLLLR